MNTIKTSSNFSINITLTDTQQCQFDEWKSHIKALHGDYGPFTWIIEFNDIGYGIIVYSELAKVELNLTEVDTW
jgi:hypothetical protein